MKLISCYIENFGGLSQYTLNFEEGVTNLCAPNGFGKTTLAEFLRAMFYGFPRKAKTLEKSKRQKYTPWNGGKCGGYLIFEVDGICYRLERTFGAAPKADTFALIDLETGRKSSRFSEEIGQELFGLDGDSFERSTYLPQLRESGPLTTPGIQAKLTCLVEDTGDINNFEKAMQTLKAKRSSLIPYRGSGGAVAEAVDQISRIQMELDRAESRKAELMRCDSQITAMQDQIQKTKSQMENLRQQWEALSETAALRRQHEDLQTRGNAAREEMQRLQTRYSLGFPDGDSLTLMGQLADKRAVAAESALTAQEESQYQRLRKAMDAGMLEEARLEQLAEDSRELLRQKAALETAVPAVKQKRVSLLMLIPGILALIGGLVLQNQGAVSYVLLGIGAALTLGGLLRKKESVQENHREQLAEVQALEAKLRIQLGSDDFEKALSNLRLAREKFLSWEAQESRRLERLARLDEQLEELFSRFGLTCEENIRAQLQRIYDHRLRWETAKENLNQIRQQIAQMPPIPTGQENSESLKQMLRKAENAMETMTEELLRLRQRSRELRRDAERIPELTGELARWQAKKADCQKKTALLDDTMEFLEKARENLTTGYLGPIRQHFARYLTLLTGGEEQVFITPELDIQLERLGQARELGYFSAGQTDLVMLCMRLALVDALFGDAKPFIILDDPFVNLDDTTTDQALKLLEKLGRERQIIYMTCSQSRRL